MKLETEEHNREAESRLLSILLTPALGLLLKKPSHLSYNDIDSIGSDQSHSIHASRVDMDRPRSSSTLR